MPQIFAAVDCRAVGRRSVGHERMPHRHLPHLPAGGFVAADPHLDTAERIGIGRGGFEFAGNVGNAIAIGIDRHFVDLAVGIVIDPIGALIGSAAAILVAAIGLVVGALGVVRPAGNGRPVQFAFGEAVAGKPRVDLAAGEAGGRDAVAEVDIGS